jgi:DNA-binding NarL/FixJ family response regulator
VIRVVIVDDHAVVRRGLAQLLDGAGDIEVVGEAADGAAAVDVVRACTPDAVLMDLQMPVRDGVAATRDIVASGVAAEVVVLMSYSDSAWIVAALDAGAVGYLLKDADPEDVLDGVRAVSRGESPIHPRAARQLLTARTGSGGRQADRAGAGGARPGPRRARRQADRPAARDLRTDGEGAPDLDLPADRRRRPDQGRTLGGTERRLDRVPGG